MRNPFSRLFRARDTPDRRQTPQDAVSAAPTFSFGSSMSGKSVTPSSAIQVSAVYACVRVIAETIASLPLHVYESTAAGSRKANEHPLYRLLHDEPNTEMTSFIWREVMLSHLLLYGNSYCQIIRSGRSRIVGLYPLLPDHMAVDRDSKGKLTYTYTTSEGRMEQLNPEDVLHIPVSALTASWATAPSRWRRRPWAGHRRGGVRQQVLPERRAAQRYPDAPEYGQGSRRPSGQLERGLWRLRQCQPRGGFGGGHDVVPLSMPNNEAQFLETRKFQVTEICRIFRVPPHMIGDLERATFSNIESQNISFAVHTIRPWLVRIEQAINKTLIPENEKGRYYAQFNIDGLMRGDYKSRMEGYAIARQNGWMSANDIRALENLNPISAEEGGDSYLVNGNMIPISLTGLGVLVGLAAQSEAEPAEEESAEKEGDENVEATDAGQPV